MATLPPANEDAAEKAVAPQDDVSYASRREALVIAERVAVEDAELLRRLSK